MKRMKWPRHNFVRYRGVHAYLRLIYISEDLLTGATAAGGTRSAQLRPPTFEDRLARLHATSKLQLPSHVRARALSTRPRQLLTDARYRGLPGIHTTCTRASAPPESPHPQRIRPRPVLPPALQKRLARLHAVIVDTHPWRFDIQQSPSFTYQPRHRARSRRISPLASRRRVSRWDAVHER